MGAPQTCIGCLRISQANDVRSVASTCGWHNGQEEMNSIPSRRSIAALPVVCFVCVLEYAVLATRMASASDWEAAQEDNMADCTEGTDVCVP